MAGAEIPLSWGTAGDGKPLSCGAASAKILLGWDKAGARKPLCWGPAGPGKPLSWGTAGANCRLL